VGWTEKCEVHPEICLFRIECSAVLTTCKLYKNYTSGRYQCVVCMLNVGTININYAYKTVHELRVGCYWLQLSVKPHPHRPITPRKHQRNL